MKLDLYNPMVFYTILLLTAFVEMYGFYASKHSTFLYAIVAFVFVGLMHSVLFVSKGMVHTHALYNIITVVLVTLLGVYDNEKVTENKTSVYSDKLAPWKWTVRSGVKFTFRVPIVSKWFK